jgi:hypothetical protein
MKINVVTIGAKIQIQIKNLAGIVVKYVTITISIK